MNAAFTYSVNKVPLTPIFNQSVVQKRTPQGTTTNYANKQDLVDYLNSQVPAAGTDTLMVINCQCDAIHMFKTADNLPDSSLICDCGRKLIVYG